MTTSPTQSPQAPAGLVPSLVNTVTGARASLSFSCPALHAPDTMQLTQQPVCGGTRAARKPVNCASCSLLASSDWLEACGILATEHGVCSIDLLLHAVSRG